jgi:NAD kinase
VVPDTETIHLTVVAGDERDVVIATVDGQIPLPIRAGDTISVRRAPYNARLLSVGGPSFYHKLRARWRYGERLQG